MENPTNPAGSRGLKVSAEPVPTAEETLEHLEQTLDNLDPVVPTTPAELRAATDAQLDVMTDAQLAAIVPEGTGQPNTSATHDEPTAP